MRLTDAQLQRYVSAFPDDTEARDELRERTIWRLIRLIPNRTGTCPHGKRIEWDQRGAYSSGYPIHVHENGNWERGYCDAYKGIVNDPATPKTLRIHAMIEKLKEAGRNA